MRRRQACEEVRMSWTRASDGRAITDAMLDAAIARDRAAQIKRMQNAGIRARINERRLCATGGCGAGVAFCLRRQRNTSPEFLRCTDRFYAQIDYDIRMWDREQALKLGVRAAVEAEERRKRRRLRMRAMVREDLVRRGML